MKSRLIKIGKYIAAGLAFGVLVKLFKSRLFELFKIIVAFLTPVVPLLLIVGGMIFIDTVTGLLKARKKKEKITSHKLGRVISKMLLYQLGIITFFLLEKYLLGEFIASFTSITFFLTKIVAVFFAGIELISINENLTEGYGINLFKQFKQMLLRVKEVKEDIGDVVDLNKTEENNKNPDAVIEQPGG